MWRSLFLVALAAICGSAESQSAEFDARYYTAQELEADCDSSLLDRRHYCRSLLTGVLGTLRFLNATEHMSEILCIPDMSAEDARIHYLSFAVDNRQQLKDMLAGAAAADMFYEKYPCVGEAERRKRVGAEAARELQNRVRMHNDR